MKGNSVKIVFILGIRKEKENFKEIVPQSYTVRRSRKIVTGNMSLSLTSSKFPDH